jgi:hypothetical protein
MTLSTLSDKVTVLGIRVQKAQAIAAAISLDMRLRSYCRDNDYAEISLKQYESIEVLIVKLQSALQEIQSSI